MPIHMFRCDMLLKPYQCCPSHNDGTHLHAIICLSNAVLGFGIPGVLLLHMGINTSGTNSKHYVIMRFDKIIRIHPIPTKLVFIPIKKLFSGVHISSSFVISAVGIKPKQKTPPLQFQTTTKKNKPGGGGNFERSCQPPREGQAPREGCTPTK